MTDQAILINWPSDSEAIQIEKLGEYAELEWIPLAGFQAGILKPGHFWFDSGEEGCRGPVAMTRSQVQRIFEIALACDDLRHKSQRQFLSIGFYDDSTDCNETAEILREISFTTLADRGHDPRHPDATDAYPVQFRFGTGRGYDLTVWLNEDNEFGCRRMTQGGLESLLPV